MDSSRHPGMAIFPTSPFPPAHFNMLPPHGFMLNGRFRYPTAAVGRSMSLPLNPRGPGAPVHFQNSAVPRRTPEPPGLSTPAETRMRPDTRVLTPGMTPSGSPRISHQRPYHGAMFSQEDLDMVLYGYARSHKLVGEHVPGHALSGLRVSELSHGIDRILGGGSPVCNVPAKKAPPQPPLDLSSLTLPEGIAIFHSMFVGTVHYGIFCKKTVISKGTRFGPFQGKVVNTSEIKTHDDNTYMWEIFRDGKLSHFIDGRGGAGNWLAYLNCARYAQEQNLIAIQNDGEILYEACKDIPQGAELLVWYGDCYLQFMGIPVALKEMADGSTQEDIEKSEGFACERCDKVFAYKYYRDKHLKYTRCVDQGDRKFPCHLCTRSFEKRDRLRIHILHVHEKHRPHKCTVCGKSFSQSSSLNKHMRVHSGERPYKCVYCNKAFTASSILRTHIRQHSGEKPFKCKHCGKAFASHAAHDSHVRRTHTKDKVCACKVCGQTFAQTYELKLHMNVHTTDEGNPAKGKAHVTFAVPVGPYQIPWRPAQCGLAMFGSGTHGGTRRPSSTGSGSDLSDDANPINANRLEQSIDVISV